MISQKQMNTQSLFSSHFQYKMLISVEDNEKRAYYELEAVKNSWTGCELERQISSGLYERLLLRNDKESVLAGESKELGTEIQKHLEGLTY